MLVVATVALRAVVAPVELAGLAAETAEFEAAAGAPAVMRPL